jgi:hypothetical protein
MERYLITFIFLWVCSFAQAQEIQGYATIHGNLYYPGNHQEQGVYPILWYGKTLTNKNGLMIGGFGGGMTAIHTIKEKFHLRYQFNISRQSFHEKPFYVTSETGSPIFILQGRTSELKTNINVLTHYQLHPKLSIGTGIGLQQLIHSQTIYKDPEYNGRTLGAEIRIVNRYYKPFIPVLPIELSFKTGKWLLNARYELGLLNRLRGDASFKENFSVLFFEIGYKIF